MRIPERTICDYCECDLSAAVEYLVLQNRIKLQIQAPTKLARVRYEFCDFDCLAHWTDAERKERAAA